MTFIDKYRIRPIDDSEITNKTRLVTDSTLLALIEEEVGQKERNNMEEYDYLNVWTIFKP